ncbi:MAG: YgaP family membrane protein [Nitrospiraceae bacterium]
MNQERRIHDGIVGAVVTAGVVLGYSVDPLWLLVPAVLGVTLIQSGLTGFCPLYYLLDKIGPTKLPTEAARSGVK